MTKFTVTRTPTTYEELANVLQQNFEALTPSQRRLAGRVLADPEGCAFMTISELADSVNVNDSTVVRFATALGLDGYPAITRLCRERLKRQAQLVQRLDALERLGSHGADLFRRSVNLDQANIARTFSRIDEADWEKAIASLVEARRVYVLGLRKTHSVAYLLGYLLELVRDEVELLSLGSGTLPDRLRRIGPDDVFIGTGIYRYPRDLVRAMQFSRERGATTLALTDTAASPLARDADFVFYVDTTGVSILRSVTGFVSLVQALAADVAARSGATTRSELLLQEEVLAHFDVYHAHPDLGELAPPPGENGASLDGEA